MWNDALSNTPTIKSISFTDVDRLAVPSDYHIGSFKITTEYDSNSYPFISAAALEGVQTFIFYRISFTRTASFDKIYSFVTLSGTLFYI